jgi:predicted 3-demethylubiquinone-9 3-methyltransferase (glyoxalase superfamily)
MTAKKQKITTFLWFDHEAEEAANHYLSIFKNSKINSVTRYGETGPGPKGSVMTVAFELDGQEFVALNGGPHFKFTEAISLVVNCDTQAEVDYYWEKLGAGGEWGPCGWLKDKYGLSWQVVPRVLIEVITSNDAQKSDRVMATVMKMGKIDVRQVEAAAARKAA